MSQKISLHRHLYNIFYTKTNIEEESMTTNLKERNIKQSTIFTDEIKQRISEMNQTHQLMLRYF
jgi:hypothetical protein